MFLQDRGCIIATPGAGGGRHGDGTQIGTREEELSYCLHQDTSKKTPHSRCKSEKVQAMKLAATHRALLMTALAVVAESAAADNPPAAQPVGEPSATAPALETFGALPAETDVVLSPDAHWLAWADHKDREPHVVIFDVLAHKTVRTLALPERNKLRGLIWSDSQTLLVRLSETTQAHNPAQRSQENYATLVADASGGNIRALPRFANLIRVNTTKPQTVIMASQFLCSTRSTCLMEVNTSTLKPEIISSGDPSTATWVVDRTGRPVAREDWDWWKSAYRVYALSGKDPREILRKDDRERPMLAGLLPDDSALVLLAVNGRPHLAAWALPLDGSPMKLLVEDPDADITAAYTDPYSGAIVGVYVSGSKNAVQWLEPAAQHRFDMLQRAFSGRKVWVYGWSEDGTRTLARVESPTSPPVYYLVDFNTHRADIAAEEYPALAGVQLGEFREISYKARDGTAIPAYLTLPPGKPASALPLVVLPHGGPNERDLPEFNWMVQFLASRGYAILQPQFRGSTGFGKDFERAGYRQWGGVMQDDVTDGVQAMIAQGLADPHRVAIVGGSYGGYAALAGAAFTPQLYACAASINGVSDLPALMRETVPAGVGFGFRVYSTSQSEWKERIGGPMDSRALAAKSPINAIAAIRAPILILYGTGDAIVPNEQSERMAQALGAAGKHVKVVTLAGEDHWLSRSETRIQVLRELDSFLSANL
jgi:dipeptidyl aminopeptidase/acylaminoacyl peptidase